MQATSKELYKKVSERTQIGNDLVKSVGDSVFQELLVFFRKPKSLICKVKGLGSWYMRKKKLYEYIHKWYSYYHQDNEPDYADEDNKKEYLTGKLQFLALLEREKEYERYLEKKTEIRKIRNKTQNIITPKTEE